jgi:hypothetical protein
MTFTPLSPLGQTELSDCRRYLVAQLWGETTWRAWRIPEDGSANVEIGKNLTHEAARQRCEEDREKRTCVGPMVKQPMPIA